MKGNKAFWFGIIGVILFIVTTILGGLQLSDYSHISQLISESYAIGTPYGLQLRYFGFIPSGIFIAIFAFLAIKAMPKSKSTQIGFLGIGIFYGLGTVLVSLFPCDKGCDKELVDPSLSQLIHNLTGLLTYTIVPISLIILGIAARQWENGKYLSLFGMLCGLVAIFFVGLLSSDLQSKLTGLYQRIAEGSVLVWILACSFYHRNFSNK
jgi:type IV secretory pathway VirB2 component (pilin)